MSVLSCNKQLLLFIHGVLCIRAQLVCVCVCVQGMVDPGELVSLTLQREFSEEAMNSLQASPLEQKKIHERITLLFSTSGVQVRNCEAFSNVQNVFFTRK